LQITLHLIHEIFEHLGSDRTFLDRFAESGLELLAHVRLALPVAFHNREVENFAFFDGRETKMTLETLPTTTNAHPALRQAGVDDFGVFMIARNAPHSIFFRMKAGMSSSSSSAAVPAGCGTGEVPRKR
jgi:hypothetical protein